MSNTVNPDQLAGGANISHIQRPLRTPDEVMRLRADLELLLFGRPVPDLGRIRSNTTSTPSSEVRSTQTRISDRKVRPMPMMEEMFAAWADFEKMESCFAARLLTLVGPWESSAR